MRRGVSYRKGGRLSRRKRFAVPTPVLPPITVARGRVLVDGFHRWQAHKREGVETIQATDLGDISDAEIFRQAITLNCTHGFQLDDTDKKRHARSFWSKFAHLSDAERYDELTKLFSVDQRTIRRWTQEEREQEKKDKRAKAWDMWLNCVSLRDIAVQLLGDEEKKSTIERWVSQNGQMSEMGQPPASLQTFDVWSFHKLDDSAGGKIFGRMPAQIIENLLWLYTDVGSTSRSLRVERRFHPLGELSITPSHARSLLKEEVEYSQ